MNLQMEHIFEIKLKQGQHFLIPAGPFVHLWRMIFAGYCLKDLL